MYINSSHTANIEIALPETIRIYCFGLKICIITIACILIAISILRSFKKRSSGYTILMPALAIVAVTISSMLGIIGYRTQSYGSWLADAIKTHWYPLPILFLLFGIICDGYSIFKFVQQKFEDFYKDE